MQRLQINIQGVVQGVGFRPFVYRLAHQYRLKGWVNNSAQGVVIEIEGEISNLESFTHCLQTQTPPLASIYQISSREIAPCGDKKFSIVHSGNSGNKTVLVLPDMATCADCRKEIFAHDDRRYLYPFTNCTNCGPRFTIIQALPYDRVHTTMSKFAMCEQCLAEYEDPCDRRFHAQPNACSQCGPHLALWDHQGRIVAERHQALLIAAQAIRDGKIVAVKGLGGFHIIADARQQTTVELLRKRKQRVAKPFALMYSSLEAIVGDCEVSATERQLLLSPEAPIVLLRSRTNSIASSVSPGNPYLGVMLPYTPLHHLLMAELQFPVVATSGNLAEEPICIDEHEALQRLGDIVDLFVVHNRPIAQHVDDSIVQVVMDRKVVLRRARGYAPLPVASFATPNLLATGAHIKNVFAVSVGKNILLSQHLGDLDNELTYQSFRHMIELLQKLYSLGPIVVACDLHPEYPSTQFAQQLSIPHVTVQHHYAHILSCMAENNLQAPVLGVAWDGTGYGLDGNIWGGEFLIISEDSFERAGYMRPFSLPGGEAAIREPQRIALSILYEIFADNLWKMDNIAVVNECPPEKRRLLLKMLAKKLNSPRTTSVGRMFDAVAAMIGICHKAEFEGQAAMALQFAAETVVSNQYYEFELRQLASNLYMVDWQSMMQQIIDDISNIKPETIAARFHNTMVEIIVCLAKKIGISQVVLSGGCFQNKLLLEKAITRLSNEQFMPYRHSLVPPNDGGIALGQALAIARSNNRYTF